MQPVQLPILLQSRILDQLYPPQDQRFYDFFTYTFPVFSALAAAGGTATNLLLIQADSDFEAVGGVYEFDNASTQTGESTYFIPNMDILLIDTGSGRQLADRAVPVTSIFGRQGLPYIWPISKVFKANSTIQCQATNRDAAIATGNLRLTLLGWKIFHYPRGSGGAPLVAG